MVKFEAAPLVASPAAIRSISNDAIKRLLADPKLLASIAQRFWRNVDKGGPDDCWPWLGGSKAKGYGNFKAQSHVTIAAHRFAFVLGHGENPGPMFVCHRCDNPPCCNPDHLWLGTCADNTADMMAKGRNVTHDVKGAANGNAKLTEADVEEVRRLILAGMTNTAIAPRFGVTHHLISRIRRGRSWGEPAMQAKYASLKGTR